MALKVPAPDLPVSLEEHLPDKLSNKRWHSYLMAKKIRGLRQMRGMTQQQLADRIGVNEAAVRNYESQKASPKKQHIEKMAEALEVRPEALKLYDMGTGDSITASALFQLAEIYGFEPKAHTDYVYLKPLNEFMSRALEEWSEQYEQLKAEELPEEEYQLWKDCYYTEFDPRSFPKRYENIPEGTQELVDNWEACCLAAKLKRLRASRDMTQSDFASLLDIKLGVYRSYEQGWRLPKVSIIESMAARLGITLGCLTFFDFGSPIQAIHALFQLASEYGLRPDVVNGQPILRTQTAGLEQIIDQWQAALSDSGDSTERFSSWQDHYDPDAPENRLPYKAQTRYTEPAGNSENPIGCFSKRDPYDPRYRHGYLPA